ncbi:MAG: prepilin-type N-terminal cleavage/methylation domain-containing protein [Elusimicrobia bacterium]|nr:prepilin-type N-terminal cleavage/methylation domain-containing protein [Elusimicrobiota bacterium]
MKRITKKGFTLIELMIVVAIIGILAAIAIPKFAELITKSKESSAKGTLGAVRSAITIYYSDTEGYFPLQLPTNFIARDSGVEVIWTIRFLDPSKKCAHLGNPGHGA